MLKRQGTKKAAGRKELWEAKYPETKRGGDRGNQHVGGKARQSENISFCQDAAEKTGRTERSIQMDIATAKNLDPEAAKAKRGSLLASETYSLKQISAKGEVGFTKGAQMTRTHFKNADVLSPKDYRVRARQLGEDAQQEAGGLSAVIVGMLTADPSAIRWICEPAPNGYEYGYWLELAGDGVKIARQAVKRPAGIRPGTPYVFMEDPEGALRRVRVAGKVDCTK